LSLFETGRVGKPYPELRREKLSTLTPELINKKPTCKKGRTSEDTLRFLWNRYLKIRDELEEPSEGKLRETQRETKRQANRLRDRLLVNYAPLVKYVVNRIGARMTGAVEQEDMISWGVLGLLGAIETYDPHRPDKKAKFESYAISKIRWTILDELRSQDWIPRRLRQRAREAERATAKLTQELRRSPTEVEIAEEMGIRVANYRALIDQYARARVASLENSWEASGGKKTGVEQRTLVEDSSAVDPQSRANFEELRNQLAEAIAALEERERLVAALYFYEGLTLKEIGQALQLTEGRISQVLKCALSKLRKLLQGEEGSAMLLCATDSKISKRADKEAPLYRLILSSKPDSNTS
jgi:RNA polymerase sigma factor for flagellar operon FliA